MEDNKKNPAPAPAPEGLEKTAKPKRRYKYIGPPFRTGIYLPDLVTKVNPDTVTDEEIDAFVKRFPKLLVNTWEKVQ